MRWSLLLIFIILSAVRLFLAFQTPYFADDTSYFTLRQAEHILEEGVPFYTDPFSDVTYVFSPAYYYLIAFLGLLTGVEIAAKVIANLLGASIIFFTYYIAHDLTKNRKVALFTAITSGFIPILFSETIYTSSPLILALPLMLALIHMFMNIGKGYASTYIVLLFFLCFTHISVYFVVFGQLFYLLLMKLEKVRTSRAELEIIIFTLFLVFWSQLLIYKKAFLEYGPMVILQNIPDAIRENYFQQISIIDGLNGIGIIPLFFGMYIIYKYAFSEKKRHIYLLLGFTLVVSLLLWMKLIPLTSGLILGGLLLSLYFSQYLKMLLLYLAKIKFATYENIVLGGIIFLFFLTSVVPSIYYTTQVQETIVPDEEIDALRFIADDSRDGKVLVPFTYGHMLSYYSGKGALMSSSFLMIDDVNQRYDIIEELYTTDFLTHALELLNTNNIGYVLISSTTEAHFGPAPTYLNDACFTPVYEDGTTKIYRSLCQIN